MQFTLPTSDEIGGQVKLRKYPFPYRAMLAICSDLDSTADRVVYFETAKFLNTTQNSIIGEGVGLEVGNSIYFYTPPDTFSYWSTDDRGRQLIRALIQSGHIDCLHSFGEKAFSRKEAEEALNELARNQCALQVWVDHGSALSNFGRDIMRGSGDVAGLGIYHADLTYHYGIRYVWMGRATSVIGQNVRHCCRGLWSAEEPVVSTKTVLVEMVKFFLGRCGCRKYEMNAANTLMRDNLLRSGQRIVEFMRSNPHHQGVDQGADAAGIACVLSRRILDRLVESEGVCILYTHLGKSCEAGPAFSTKTQNSFRLLSEYQGTNQILVATTRRVLGYCQAVRTADVTAVQDEGGGYDIRIDYQGPPEDLDGVTFYVTDPCRTRVHVNGNNAVKLQVNGPDHTQRPSVSIPWKRLEFPKV